MDWWECGDIKVYSDAGEVLYSGPIFVRCEEYACRSLVTDGQIKAHGACVCGGRRYRMCRKLTDQERIDLEADKYLLADWEREMIFGKDHIELPEVAAKEKYFADLCDVRKEGGTPDTEEDYLLERIQDLEEELGWLRDQLDGRADDQG